LDMPGVTLVGVINADITLHMPDFRAAERTFQLVAQVAGRAGRGELGGEVLVQTLSPDHYSVVFAAAHDYSGFYRQEMKIRKALRYPPFTRLARVLFTGHDEEEVKNLSGKWAAMMGAAPEGQGVEILGPAPAPLARVKDRYRYHIILKAAGGNSLRGLLRPLMDQPGMKAGGINVAVDIDPLNLI